MARDSMGLPAGAEPVAKGAPLRQSEKKELFCDNFTFQEKLHRTSEK